MTITSANLLQVLSKALPYPQLLRTFVRLPKDRHIKRLDTLLTSLEKKGLIQSHDFETTEIENEELVTKKIRGYVKVSQ